MEGNGLTPAEVLGMIPQKPPFRFIDEILELDDDHVVANYRFREDEYFYRGHFPGNPITPGVVLIETMAQAGVVALGIYLQAKSKNSSNVQQMLTLFTEAEAEFQGVVRPGQTVTVHARKVFFRRGKLRVEATMHTDDGRIACSGVLAGIGVKPE